MISYKAAVASAPGGKSTHNGDNFYFNTRYLTEDLSESQVLLSHKKNQRGLQIYAVCDGSNGDNASEEASLILAKNLLKYHKKLVDNPNCDVPQTINEYIDTSNQQVNEEIRHLMGKNIYSTLALLCVEKESTLICSVGDSRIYGYVGGTFSQLTEDHTQAQRMVQLGLLTPERAATHVKRDKLTQYFGSMPAGMSVKPFMETMVTNNGDTYVLCTRGFYDAVPESVIEETLSKKMSPADTVDELMAYAMDKGIKNDATVLVVTACDSNKVIVPIVAGTLGATHEKKEAATLFAHDDEFTPAENAKQSYEEYNEGNDGDSEDVDSFIGKLLSPFRRGGTRNANEFWPALVIFAVCVLAVIVLSVFGYNLFLRNRTGEPVPTTTPVYYETATPTPEVSPTPTINPGPVVTNSPDGNNMLDPNAPTEQAPAATATPAPTATATTAPTATATTAPVATPAPTQAPTSAPTQAPTDEPVTPPAGEENGGGTDGGDGTV